MKTNVPTLRRYAPAAALLLILTGTLSACEPTESVNPKPGDIHMLSPIAADTIVVDPADAEPIPTPTKPIHDPEPQDL